MLHATNLQKSKDTDSSFNYRVINTNEKETIYWIKMDLSYSHSICHFKCDVCGALTLACMHTFLAKMKKVVKRVIQG